jgi:prepilin-type N-terminal cleavage/methylation domain-containing protein
MTRPYERFDERGMTLIELAIVVIVLGILLSLAVATVFRARMAANEGSALAALRTINTAQFQYQSSCGSGLYASSLTVLGTKPAGETQAFLNADLGSAVSPTRSGYTFRLGMGSGGAAGINDCNGTPTLSRYYAAAAPASPQSGNRSFATNQTGALWEALNPMPPTEPFGPPAELAH